MSNLDVKDVAYYGKPIASLSKEKLLQVLLELAKIINECPVKGNCKQLLDASNTKRRR